MPLPKLALLTGKEFRDLLSARAFWLLLLLVGPLVGHGFITAVDTYAEASGIHGGTAALSQGLYPLDGILSPSFGAYDLTLTLLFPFVAIHLVAADRATGAWKLMLQAPAGVGTILFAKALALFAGWLLAWIPGLLTLMLWKLYGGALYAPEVANLLLGYVLRMLVATGVAVAAASPAGSAASAAIATLGFTVGAWVLEFVAAGRGGWLERLASHTPTAMLRPFERGLLPLSAVGVSLILGFTGFALAAVWLSTRRTVRRRAAVSVAVLVAAAASVWAVSWVRPAWDLSENRRNSFTESEEAALQRIREPLHISVYLAAEDPRRLDFDRNLLSKLARVVPNLSVSYISETRTGLFHDSGDHYGEIWYEIAGRRRMSRSTTEPIVLELLYELAQVSPPAHNDEPSHSGHPLPARPTGAAALFYIMWPIAVTLACWVYWRQ